MTAGVEKDDEVRRMVTAGGAAGTDGFRVRRSLVQIVHVKIEMELLWDRIVRPRRRLGQGLGSDKKCDIVANHLDGRRWRLWRLSLTDVYADSLLSAAFN